MEKAWFFNFTLKELQDYLVGHGIEKFRAQQLFKWVYQRNITDFELMTDISKTLRQRLPELLSMEALPMVQRRQSSDGTEKYLFQVEGGKTVEAVLIPSADRLTLCVSSEVGCNMACRFCYTGTQKLQRRLTAGEITGQLFEVSKLLPEGERISNIVFMGMGEPLDNPDNVFRSIQVMHEANAFGISLKKITVSTSGLVHMIPKVAEAGVRLAVSLNGSNNQMRTEVMPINKKWPIEELMQACRDYYYVSKDKITFEYVLLKGVTDSIEAAHELYHLTKQVPSKINIIPFNEHPNSPYERPSERAVQAFQDELMHLGAHVLRRKTMGRDIYAACGQLTSAFKGKPEHLQLA